MRERRGAVDAWGPQECRQVCLVETEAPSCAPTHRTGPLTCSPGGLPSVVSLQRADVGRSPGEPTACSGLRPLPAPGSFITRELPPGARHRAVGLPKRLMSETPRHRSQRPWAAAGGGRQLLRASRGQGLPGWARLARGRSGNTAAHMASGLSFSQVERGRGSRVLQAGWEPGARRRAGAGREQPH